VGKQVGCAGYLSCTRDLRRRLQLARGQALLRPHPMQQCGEGVEHLPTNLHVGRAVAAHTRLGKPGFAHVENLCRLLWRQSFRC
jgi:hypothetical protein